MVTSHASIQPRRPVIVLVLKQEVEAEFLKSLNPFPWWNRYGSQGGRGEVPPGSSGADRKSEETFPPADLRAAWLLARLLHRHLAQTQSQHSTLLVTFRRSDSAARMSSASKNRLSERPKQADATDPSPSGWLPSLTLEGLPLMTAAASKLLSHVCTPARPQLRHPSLSKRVGSSSRTSPAEL